MGYVYLGEKILPTYRNHTAADPVDYYTAWLIEWEIHSLQSLFVGVANNYECLPYPFERWHESVGFEWLEVAQVVIIVFN